ncbi:MAG TPA: alpha/beta hydrolase-fold protein [Thermoanaerobaculia bacterium]|nr:alpha/beta hydrolase-fold protein [Thermoanaerobaculia bacterium]
MNDPQPILTALENAPALLIPLILDVPEPLRKRRLTPDKWSAHEHFCHVVSLEAKFRGRLRRMLTEENPELEPFYPTPEEEGGGLLTWNLAETAERFARERGELAAILRALPPEAWERAGRHPEYEGYTVYVLARHITLHDMLHGYRIEDVLRRREWLEEIHTEPAPPAPEHPPVETGIPGSLARMKPGEVNLLGPFTVPGLAPRLIRIYLPRNYNPAEPHFGLYMFDGQNVFDDLPSFSGGWYVHEAVEGLARARRPQPVVIGIDHGGPGRNLELSPFPFEAEPGRLSILLDWVAGSLIPALTAELNLVPGPLGAIVGGSSMGGLAAFWAHFHHPRAFGGALVMSPSFWVANQAIFADTAAQPTPEVSRIYLDGGAREAKGQVVEFVKKMVEQLTARGWDSDRLMWRADAKGTHSEAAWRRRLPQALRFMYQ